jgi:hypothetical protein
MKCILSAVFTLAIVHLMAQSAPQKMSYQAVARNSAGVILSNQTISVKAEILNADLTTVVYAETHSTTTNQFGLFTLQVGTGSIISGTFASINWGVGDKFIRTSADLTGGTNYQLLGTSQLLTVPYAFYAEKTKLVAGTDISVTNGNTISATNSSKWTNVTNGISYSNTNGGVAIGGNVIANNALTVTQRATNGNSGAATFTSSDTWQSVIGFNNTSSNGAYQFNLAGSGNTAMPSKSFSLFHNGANNFVWNTDGTNNSFIAIGSNGGVASVPKSRLHVFNGDVNIDQVGRGIIMKSPNGSCWRVTIDNNGEFVRTAITCP